MKYCANCGTEINAKIFLCPSCFFDPNIPEEIVDKELNNFALSKKEKRINSLIEFPGESSSLVLSILLMIIIALFFSAITFGLFFVFMFGGLIYVRIFQARDKSQFVKVSKDNFTEIYKLSKLAAFRLKTPIPPVFIKEDPNYNAYTSGFWGDHWIVIHSAIIKQFKPQEILFIIGHETGHIKKEHATWLSLTSARGSRALPVVRGGLSLVFNNWHIKSEYTADRAGLIANKELNSCISALVMLSSGQRDINIDSYLNNSDNIQNNYFTKISELAGSHPFTPNRIRQLKTFSMYLK